MSKLIEICVPLYPECWETCGSCAQGDVMVEEVLVKAGDMLQRDDNVIVLETGKVALDIPPPVAGRVVAIHVTAGDTVDEGAPLISVDMD